MKRPVSTLPLPSSRNSVSVSALSWWCTWCILWKAYWTLLLQYLYNIRQIMNIPLSISSGWGYLRKIIGMLTTDQWQCSISQNILFPIPSPKMETEHISTCIIYFSPNVSKFPIYSSQHILPKYKTFRPKDQVWGFATMVLLTRPLSFL